MSCPLCNPKTRYDYTTLDRLCKCGQRFGAHTSHHPHVRLGCRGLTWRDSEVFDKTEKVVAPSMEEIEKARLELVKLT